MEASSAVAVPLVDSRARRWLGLASTLVLAALLIAWAKWIPYLHKFHVTSATGVYPGHDLLAKAGHPAAGPSLSAGWAFTKAYAVAVWPALVAGLVIAAAIETLTPRDWLRRWLGSRTGGGVAGVPSMMCTCCTAPVARTLRRCGVPVGPALSYWLANPVLNPAVIAFLAVVLPWQWVATRIAVGSLLVFGATGLIARLGRHDAPAEALPAAAPVEPRAFPRRLVRLTLLLVPEYLLVVLAVGMARGWLLPLGGGGAHAAVVATLVAAVLGTLVVIPTGGEIPLIAGLAAGGLGVAPLGALLITLPAISLPSMVMVGRAFSWRIRIATAAAVAACGLLAALLLAAIS